MGNSLSFKSAYHVLRSFHRDCSESSQSSSSTASSNKLYRAPIWAMGLRESPCWVWIWSLESYLVPSQLVCHHKRSDTRSLQGDPPRQAGSFLTLQEARSGETPCSSWVRIAQRLAPPPHFTAAWSDWAGTRGAPGTRYFVSSVRRNK